MEKVFVLLSGGIDSTTTLAIAKEDFPKAEFEAVSIDYGQRHAVEMEAARKVCNHYGIPHVIIPVKGIMEGMLIDKPNNEAIPNASYADLPEGISPTYVTFRNGLMLSVLAARAQAWVMARQNHDKHDQFLREHGRHMYQEKAHVYDAVLYCGIHADDGANWAYPDCTPEFAGPMAAAIFVGTYQRVRLRTPLLTLSKAEVVRIGVRLDAPYEYTWSCYAGGEKHCGTCMTCRSRKEAFEFLGEPDPTEYAE